ncbi:35412_t:CDS:1, partial [Gigaspora margarita]
ELQKEQNHIQVNVKAIMRGAPRPPQRRHTIEHEQHIQMVFNDRQNRSVMDYLRGIVHNIAF